MIQTRDKEVWIYDVSWSWSEPLPAQSNAAVREKSQSLTLTMTHNPTHISLIKSASLVQNKLGKISQLRSQLWLELFHELQRKLLSNQDLAA
jgi:hypothetical protein